MVEKYPVDDKTAQKFEDLVHRGDGQSAMNLVEQVGSCHWPNLLQKANWEATIWGHGFQIVDSANNTEDTVRLSLTRRNFNLHDVDQTTSTIAIGTSKELPRCKDP